MRSPLIFLKSPAIRSPIWQSALKLPLTLSLFSFQVIRMKWMCVSCAYVKHANRFDRNIWPLIGWGVSANQYIHGRWSKIFAFVCTLHLLPFFLIWGGAYAWLRSIFISAFEKFCLPSISLCFTIAIANGINYDSKSSYVIIRNVFAVVLF